MSEPLNLVITTKSGSIYELRDSRWWREGMGGRTVITLFGIPETMSVMDAHRIDLYDPASVKVGLRMYVSDSDSWAISTRIETIVRGSDEPDMETVF
jgi:hypothetical protein